MEGYFFQKPPQLQLPVQKGTPRLTLFLDLDETLVKAVPLPTANLRA